MMKRIIISVLCTCLLSVVYGQQQPAWSQYMINKFLINPALAGSTDDLQISASYRKLYAGVKETPSSEYLMAHMKVAEKMGVGASVFSRSSGLTSRTGFSATYAYHVPLSGDGQHLAFGLSGMFYYHKINTTGDNFLEDPNDPLIDEINNRFIPDATFGTHYYSDNYYIGFTASQLFQWKVGPTDNKDSQTREVRHYYLNGGYRIDVSQDLSIEPSAMLKVVETPMLQADVSVLAHYRKMFWAGTIYRPNTAIVILLGGNYGPLSFGYSYDMNLADIKANSFGSHEILLMYRTGNFLLK